jgi:hypothetical protein
MHRVPRWLLAGLLGLATVVMTPAAPSWAATDCTADQQKVGGITVQDPADQQPSFLDIYMSPSCGQAWAEFVDRSNSPVTLGLWTEAQYGGPAADYSFGDVVGNNTIDTPPVTWYQSFQVCAAEQTTSVCSTWR